MIRMSALCLLIRFIILCIERHCALNNLCVNPPPTAPALIKPTYESVKTPLTSAELFFFFPSLCDTSHLSKWVFLYTNWFSKKSTKKEKSFFPPSLSLRGVCRRNMCLDDFSNRKIPQVPCCLATSPRNKTTV